MSQSSMVGSRIRERRVLSGIRQSDLAKRAGISASYLNLIEHNRRRIGGKTLLQLAAALEVEPAWLSEGAEAAVIDALNTAAGAQPGHTAELDRLEEFAGRFPGWAGLVASTAQRNATLEETVQALTDRLAHDPHLAASLHEVISTVTAIRSTASILAHTKEIEPEWRTRFNRNINEDSRRLAEGAEALVRYLEAAPEQSSEIRSPQDELDAFLTQHSYHFADLEHENAAEVGEVDALIKGAPALVSEAGRDLAKTTLHWVSQDAQALPLDQLEPALRQHGMNVEQLIATLDVAPTLLFRRLALLPDALSGPVGLVISDASGATRFRKAISGFVIPSSAGACPLWPLYQVLSQPNLPIRAKLIQAAKAPEAIQTYSVAEYVSPAKFEEPAQVLAYMLMLPADAEDDTPARHVGSTCRICPRDGCTARRERSILTKRL